MPVCIPSYNHTHKLGTLDRFTTDRQPRLPHYASGDLTKTTEDRKNKEKVIKIMAKFLDISLLRREKG